MIQKFGLVGGMFATIALANEFLDSVGCLNFKSYVDESFDCTEDYATCITTEIDCEIYVCDGTSEAERNVAKGGILYNLNCSSMVDEDIWTKICELNKAWYPEDTSSGSYDVACKRDNAGCDAVLDLSPEDWLTYEWTITCGMGSGEETLSYEDEIHSISDFAAYKFSFFTTFAFIAISALAF